MRNASAPTTLTRSTSWAPSPPTAASRVHHTGRNGVDFDVAVVASPEADGASSRSPAAGSNVVDWAERGILVLRANTPFDHDLFLVDPDSGEATLLTPHDDEVAFDSARLLPDGSVLCASDGGGEFARLAVLRRGAGPELLTPDDADVENVALDEARTHRAWTVNRGGESEVWLDGVRLAGLPGGVARRTHLRARRRADDHRRATRRLDRRVDGRARRAPAHALRRGRPRPLGAFVRPVLERVESFDGRSIPYLRFGAAGRPALCWVHGGPESQFRPQMAPVIQYLCARASRSRRPNVRGSTGYGRTYHHLDDVERRLDSVSDLAALARALGAGTARPLA